MTYIDVTLATKLSVLGIVVTGTRLASSVFLNAGKAPVARRLTTTAHRHGQLAPTSTIALSALLPTTRVSRQLPTLLSSHNQFPRRFTVDSAAKMPPKKAPSSPSSRFKKAPATSSTKGPVVLYWHRTDLRLHDSPGLQHALSLSPTSFYPVWTWDPHYVFKARAGANRWRFLVECMQGLDDGYRKISGSGKKGESSQQLWVVREGPTTAIPKLCKLWGITHLVFEGDGDWYARQRDAEVTKAVEGLGVEVKSVWAGRTLFVEEDVVKGNGGKATTSMAQLLKAVEKQGLEVRRPFDTIEKVPDPGTDVLESLKTLEKDQRKPHETEGGRDDINAEARSKGEATEYVSLLGPNGDCGVPTLEEMGIDPQDATGPHHGGEENALRELKRVLDDEEYTATFEKPKTAPTDFNPRATTVLSAHLHFGSLSVRQFYWGIQDVFEKRRKARKPVAAEPMNLIGQLLFRDMYFAAQYALGHAFQGEKGNEVCRVVDWYLPSDDKGGYEVDDEDAEQWFLRWKEGRTGFPFVDALMRQLKMEGWIHHLGRHMVACFLTRGGCYVHWERGKEVFEEWLIDHESASNAGNWMW